MSKDEAQQTQATTGGETPQEIDRIRQIIFGPQMRENEQHRQTTQRDIERLQQQVDRLTEQLASLESDQALKLKNLRQEMRESDDDIRQEVRESAQRLASEKVDRVVLGELFVTLGSHLKTGGSLDGLTGGSLSRLLQSMDNGQ